MRPAAFGIRGRAFPRQNRTLRRTGRVLAPSRRHRRFPASPRRLQHGGIPAACCRNRPERLPPGPARRRYTRAAAGGICGPPEGTAAGASRIRPRILHYRPALPPAACRLRRRGPAGRLLRASAARTRRAAEHRRTVCAARPGRCPNRDRPGPEARAAVPPRAADLRLPALVRPRHRSFRRHQCGGRRSAGGTLEQSSGRSGSGAAPRSPAGKSGSASHLVPASGPRRSAQLRPGNDRTTRNGSHPGRAARYRAAADRAERGRAPGHAPRPDSA